MPMYDYHCQNCGKDTDKLVTYEGRDLVSCPDCGDRVIRKVSDFSFKMYNPFTKDGEGFTSKTYSTEEYKERIKHSIAKDVKV